MQNILLLNLKKNKNWEEKITRNIIMGIYPKVLLMLLYKTTDKSMIIHLV